jgi:hypothetical protein
MTHEAAHAEYSGPGAEGEASRIRGTSRPPAWTFHSPVIASRTAWAFFLIFNLSASLLHLIRRLPGRQRNTTQRNATQRSS